MLSVGEFSHDSADLLLADPGRMCNNTPTGPAPRIRTRRFRPRRRPASFRPGPACGSIVARLVAGSARPTRIPLVARPSGMPLGPRARHLTRENVCQGYVLAG